MKILLTHRYFWPDTAPYALMLRSIGAALAAAGHEVHIFASRPSYRAGQTAPRRERLGVLEVRRCRVLPESRRNPVFRLLNVFIYCTALFFRVLRLRPDVVSASTFPPVVAAWSASLAARLVGAKFVYHMMDIHPEVSKYSGGRLGRGLVFRLLRWLDNQTLRRAAAIVVLSKDMENTLKTRGLGVLPIHIINNFLLDDFDKSQAPPAEYRKEAGKFRVIFAGNLGRFQNLDLLTEGVARAFAEHPELELFLLGDGAALPGLKARWKGHKQVKFAPFLPFSQARALIEEADLGLVSLSPDIYRVAYPSKLLTYLGLGVPVLALVEPESELAIDVESRMLGVVPQSTTAAGVRAALGRALQQPDSTSNIKDWSETTGATRNILAQWQDLLLVIQKAP